MKRILIFILARILREGSRPRLYQSLGVKVGQRNRYTGAINFGSEPYLIEIGDDVTLAQGTTFITHDGGASLFRSEYPGLNVYGRIKIGNNVFIGTSVTILPGVSIGDNVVVGACSLVTRSVPSNVVVAGVPARVLKGIDDYRTNLLRKGILLQGGAEERRRRIEAYLASVDTLHSSLGQS